MDHQKYKPTDSEEDTPRKDQIVKQPEDKAYRRLDADMDKAAMKRKYSEQPPTKHNSKT